MAYLDHQKQQKYNLSFTNASNNSCEPVSMLTANEICAAFVLQYFKIMKTRPQDLAHFYTSESQVSRISLDKTHDSSRFSYATGLDRITKLLNKEHGYGPPISVAVINQMDCQDTIHSGVFMQLFGTLKYTDDTSRDFTMSTLLLRQIENGDALPGYYIYNDVFTFHQSAAYPNSTLPNKTENLSMSENLYVPQSQMLSQSTLKPASASSAHSAHPAAAPLPTTTTPKLTTFLDKHTPICDLKLVFDQENTQNLESAIKTEKANQGFSVLEKVSRELANENSKLDQKNPSNNLNAQLNDTKLVGQNAENALRVVSSQPLEKPLIKNAWQSVKPVIVNDKDIFYNVSQQPAKQKPNSTDKSQSSFSTQPSNATNKTSSKDSNILKPAELNKLYPQNTYAGALLLTGPTHPVIRVTNMHSKNSQNEVKPAAPLQELSDKSVNQAAHNIKKPQPKERLTKKLWVSYIPNSANIEETKLLLNKEIANKGVDGAILRIDRVQNQHYGYIELNTEQAAEQLIQTGLQIYGREVAVKYPTRFINNGGKKFHPSNNNSMRKNTNQPGRTYNKEK